MILKFSDQDLTKIAGWKAWNAGKSQSSLFENLKIKGVAVSGFIKQGRKKTHTSVKLVDGIHTPQCTCADFYATHGFCVHSVALLLQAREVKSSLPVDSVLEGKKGQATKTEEQWTLRGDLSIPLNDLKEGRPISLKIHVSRGTEQGNALLPFVHALGLPLKPESHLIQLPYTQLSELLRLNAYTPFLFHEDGAILGSVSACKFPVTAVRQEDAFSLTLHDDLPWAYKAVTKRDVLLLHETSHAYNLQVCQDSQITRLITALFSGGVTCSMAELLEQSEELSRWLDLQEVSALIQPLLKTSPPVISLALNGTVKSVTAVVKVLYEDQAFPLTTSTEQKGSRILRYTPSDDAFLIKDDVAERRASQALKEAGFTNKKEGEFILNGESDIQELIAYTLPQLQRDKWDVSMMGSFRAFALNTTVLALTLKVDPYTAHDDFASFTYTFQTPKGQGMKASDVQRLMLSGKQSFKLKGGQIALLSRKQYQLISEALLDSSVKQVGEKYNTLKRNIQYLSNLGINAPNDNKEKGVKLDFKEHKKLRFFDKLRPYQKEGVIWLIQTLKADKCALLADDMGLGKTIQTIAVADYLGTQEKGEILIVCPASLLSNWRAEIQMWLPETTLSFTLVSYQKYLADSDKHHTQEYLFCILDEASMIKNPSAKISKALGRQSARYKLALTGTPLENSATDLWSIFQFLLPAYLGNLKQFQERFVKPLEKSGYTAQLASKRLKAKLEAYSLRRVKARVLKDLPPKTYRIDYCDMNSVQKRAGEKIKEDYKKLKAEAKSSKQSIQILTSVLRLRQNANDPKLTNPDVKDYSPKTERLVEILGQAKQLRKKVLVFSQFAEMLKLLKSQLSEQGFKCSLLTGATADRDAEIQSFKDPDGNDVFLISLKAGGYGLNLTEASIVIHYDPWWNPAVENQATDRAYRIGQAEPVSVIKLISANSIDERIMELQKSKQNLYSLAIDDQKPNFTGLSSNELESLLT